ncbi:MAG: hypothetical protein AVDCRST_MAG68-569, partial [uncultured Gemmatimonadetes bacterium]
VQRQRRGRLRRDQEEVRGGGIRGGGHAGALEHAPLRRTLQPRAEALHYPLQRPSALALRRAPREHPLVPRVAQQRRAPLHDALRERRQIRQGAGELALLLVVRVRKAQQEVRSPVAEDGLQQRPGEAAGAGRGHPQERARGLREGEHDVGHVAEVRLHQRHLARPQSRGVGMDARAPARVLQLGAQAGEQAGIFFHQHGARVLRRPLQHRARRRHRPRRPLPPRVTHAKHVLRAREGIHVHDAARPVFLRRHARRVARPRAGERGEHGVQRGVERGRRSGLHGKGRGVDVCTRANTTPEPIPKQPGPQVAAAARRV